VLRRQAEHAQVVHSLSVDDPGSRSAFGGLTYEEMAEALGLSTSTLHSELHLAKAWLRHELE
jgi:hypothetical protein